MRVRDSISWNSLIASSPASSSSADEALLLFRWMLRSTCSRGARVSCDHATFTTVLSVCARATSLPACAMVHGLVVSRGFEGEVSVGNALVTAYFESGSPGSTKKAFYGMAERNVITWTTMISGMARAQLYFSCDDSVGFAQNGLEEKAFELFAEMAGEGICIDTNMVSAVLGAFSVSPPFAFGKQIHALVIKKCFGRNIYVSNGLINMYSKCGELQRVCPGVRWDAW
ncbi:hypothetical protein ZWY2020_012852 [Hordeum vulgare]|nr:hypothetical protein ZWY2020_012852 [Hordeum vulgare]